MEEKRNSIANSQRSSIASVSDAGSFTRSTGIPLPLVSYSRPLKQRYSTNREIVALASNDILAAQKRSSDVALAELQINAERDQKRLRLEAQTLENQKAELSCKIKQLERRLAESEGEVERTNRLLEQTKLDAQNRVDAILVSHNQDDSLSEVFL